MIRKVLILCLAFTILCICGCSTGSTENGTSGNLQTFYLGQNAKGCLEIKDNIKNLTVVSKDTNIYRAEYNAGFVQGRLQKPYLTAARDNTWDSMYLMDPSHSFPAQLPPSKEEIAQAKELLLDNFTYSVDYIYNQQDAEVQKGLKRLMFRMLGIYHGAVRNTPEQLDFSGNWIPGASYFTASELQLGYETPSITWMDVYFLNANADMNDVISFSKGRKSDPGVSKCSAFVKKTDEDIFITHNSWYSFLAQSITVNLFVNQDFITMNALTPGLVGSNTDFGYNNKGIMFNETTHHATYSEPKVRSLWSFWRSILAEQFSESLDDFFKYISLEPSGTYMNGYMVVDAKTGEIGLVEMSYKSFVFFQSSGVTTKPDGLSRLYDTDMVQPGYILGVNYPASYQIREDLQAVDTRPARKRQFMEMIGGVAGIESSKDLITYTDPLNPLSIYGRWDLGYGETSYPKTVPDGSIDAKAASASMALDCMDFEGTFDLSSSLTGFWMKYGTPSISGKPFIWSESQWKTQTLRDVPDRVDGSFNQTNLYLK
jgi:hypothetical protein